MPYGEEQWRGKSSQEMPGNLVPRAEKPNTMVQKTDTTGNPASVRKDKLPGKYATNMVPSQTA